MCAAAAGRVAPVLLWWLVLAWATLIDARAAAAAGIEQACARPPPGAIVSQPPELHSRNGVLKLDLRLRNYRDPDGSVRYCYLSARRQRITHAAAASRRPADSAPDERSDRHWTRPPWRALPRHEHAPQVRRTGSLHQRRDDRGIHQPALPRAHGAARVPSGRCAARPRSSPAIRRSNTASASRRTSRPDCTGITRTFTASAAGRCWAARPAP